MHARFTKGDGLTGEVVGAAIQVHRIMGPGLLESIYERCLLRELEQKGTKATKDGSPAKIVSTTIGRSRHA